MTERVIITVKGGLVTGVKIPDYADIEVEIQDYDVQDDPNKEYDSEVHVNPIDFKILYQLTTEDIKAQAENWEDHDELSEEVIEYLMGGAGQRYVQKAIEYGIGDQWDLWIVGGIHQALEGCEDYEKPEPEKVTA